MEICFHFLIHNLLFPGSLSLFLCALTSFTDSRYISTINKFVTAKVAAWKSLEGPQKKSIYLFTHDSHRILFSIFHSCTQLHGRPVRRFECRSRTTERYRLAQRDEEATEPSHQVIIVKREKYTSKTPTLHTTNNFSTIAEGDTLKMENEEGKKWLSFHTTFNIEWNNRTIKKRENEFTRITHPIRSTTADGSEES